MTAATGNHAVEGVEGERHEGAPLEVVHLPLRSWEQFSRKISVGREAVIRNLKLSTQMAWHRRADYERLTSGALESEC